MIKLTTMDNRTVVINVNLIEKIENMPETVITLTSGKKVIVLDSMDEVIEKATAYQGMVLKEAGTFQKRWSNE
ncbi:flagellar FlbD family protein [Desulfitibacter alkalitolerans]|uniref:flagellar FlbD family protein n=1 Tax=Desulfitibacter alkalitolerans TaxID=264641 RepID=UPI0004826596|nr:flagellar FlbD family protein [Desulfitibacter alkalitolerans]